MAVKKSNGDPHIAAYIASDEYRKVKKSARSEPTVFLPRVAFLVRTHALRQPQLHCRLPLGLPFRVRGHPGKG
jgi:hypothetical protein